MIAPGRRAFKGGGAEARPRPHIFLLFSGRSSSLVTTSWTCLSLGKSGQIGQIGQIGDIILFLRFPSTVFPAQPSRFFACFAAKVAVILISALRFSSWTASSLSPLSCPTPPALPSPQCTCASSCPSHSAIRCPPNSQISPAVCSRRRLYCGVRIRQASIANPPFVLNPAPAADNMPSGNTSRFGRSVSLLRP